MAAVKTGSEQPDFFSLHIFLLWQKEIFFKKKTHFGLTELQGKPRVRFPRLVIYMFHNQYLFDKSKQSA